MSRTPFVVMLLSLAACAAPPPPPPPPVDVAAIKDAIQAREKEWSAAYLAGDGSAVASLYTEDGASIPATGDWERGRDRIAQSMQVQLDSMTVSMREDITQEVIPAGDYVVEFGDYRYQGTSKMDGKPKSGSGRYMVLWRKDADGVWRLHRDIGNEAPPRM
jgi:uncharacterized protein (TIGR02246 family)